MSKYHISNGKPKPCEADIGNCPRGGKMRHFDTIKEAEEFIEASWSHASRGAFGKPVVSRRQKSADSPDSDLPAKTLGEQREAARHDTQAQRADRHAGGAPRPIPASSPMGTVPVAPEQPDIESSSMENEDYHKGVYDYFMRDRADSLREQVLAEQNTSLTHEDAERALLTYVDRADDGNTLSAEDKRQVLHNSRMELQNQDVQNGWTPVEPQPFPSDDESSEDEDNIGNDDDYAGTVEEHSSRAALESVLRHHTKYDLLDKFNKNVKRAQPHSKRLFALVDREQEILRSVDESTIDEPVVRDSVERVVEEYVETHGGTDGEKQNAVEHAMGTWRRSAETEDARTRAERSVNSAAGACTKFRTFSALD